jgi:Zn-dependent peptidase ImmA (M78 family)
VSPAKSRYHRLSTSRATELAELAEFVAEEFPVDGAVPLESILVAKDILPIHGHYEDAFDGLLEQRLGRFAVYLNIDRLESVESARARFTIAHELGHYFIDEHRNALLAGVETHPSQVDFLSGNPIEVEADHFASNLLMPRSRFLKAAKSLPVGLGSLRKLASHFRASLTSTTIRFVSLGIKPAAVVHWTPEGYSWKWLSPQLFEDRYWKTIEDLESVPADSPTSRALQASNGSSEIFSAGSTAATWFRGVFPGTSRDLLLMEEAVRLGRFGVLTLLYPIN